MKTIPKSTLRNSDLDPVKVREAIKGALAQPEPTQNFDSEAHLQKLKTRVKAQKPSNHRRA